MNPPLFGPPGHWRVLPQLDPRGMGELQRGHSRVPPCAACAAPRVAPAVAMAVAPAAPAAPAAASPAAPPTPPVKPTCRLCGEPAAKSTAETDPELVALCPTHRHTALKRRWETRGARKPRAVVPPLTELDRVLLGALVVTLDGRARVLPAEVTAAVATMGARNTDGSELAPLRAPEVRRALNELVAQGQVRDVGAYYQVSAHGMRAAGRLLRSVGAMQGHAR